MSKRGNPDYFKTAGHAAEDVDTGEQAKRRFSQARSVSMRGATRWLKPERPPRTIKAEGVREGDLPWRVTQYEERPPLRMVPGEAHRSWRKSAIRLAVRVVLAPVHTALSIADALVERALWRLEQQT
jgi:hypothetical protein